MMRPVGWRNESYRHYLAAKGIKTRFYARRVPFIVKSEEGKLIALDPAQRYMRGERALPVPEDPKAYYKEPVKARRDTLTEQFGVRSAGGDIMHEGQLGVLNGQPVIVATIKRLSRRELYADADPGEILPEPGVYVELKDTTRPEGKRYVEPGRISSVYDMEGKTVSIKQDVEVDGKAYVVAKYGMLEGEPTVLLERPGEAQRMVRVSDVKGVYRAVPSPSPLPEETQDGFMAMKHAWWKTDRNEGLGDYLHRNLDAHERNGMERFRKGVRGMAQHPMKDLDGEWREYTSLVSNKYYGPYGHSERLARRGSAQRAEQRGAALFGRVVSQANVEPLVDTRQDRSFRDIMLDIEFGRRL